MPFFSASLPYTLENLAHDSFHSHYDLGVFCKRKFLTWACGQNLGLNMRKENVRMYSKEEREKAIKLYIKYDKCAADVIRELGYPDRKTLVKWYRTYVERGVLFEQYPRSSTYSLEQKKTAVDYYLEHGRNLSRTTRTLGYPSRETLRSWCKELVPGFCNRHVSGIKVSKEQKKEVVFEPYTRTDIAKDVAKKYGITQERLYNWKKELFLWGEDIAMDKEKDKSLPDDRDALLSEIETLKRQIERLKLEKDILERTVEIIKKDPGVDPKKLTNKEKAELVDALRDKYSLKELLDCLGLARSSYFYHRKIALLPDKYEMLRHHIKELFDKNYGCYGYRRIHALLARERICVSEKVVRRIMLECGLVVTVRKKRKYNAYESEKLPTTEDLIKRNFYAEAPNVKWITDITEFSIPAGKVYLSPIIDCFDGLVVSWSIGTSPNAELVNSMLDRAIETLKKGEHPIIHSDRGSHYRWSGWVSRIDKVGLKQSMSQKACPQDNAACEGFFGLIKNEMFYNRSWKGVSIKEFIEILDTYLVWYNEKRVKLSLGIMSPIEYRQTLGLAA